MDETGSRSWSVADLGSSPVEIDGHGAPPPCVQNDGFQYDFFVEKH